MKPLYQRFRLGGVYSTLGARLSGLLLLGATAGSIVPIGAISIGSVVSLSVDSAVPASRLPYDKLNRQNFRADLAPEMRSFLAAPCSRLISWPAARVVATWMIQLAGVVTLVCFAVRRFWKPRSAVVATKTGDTNCSDPLLQNRENVEVGSAADLRTGGVTEAALFALEKAEMLAAISHDLQTPVTRLRLRIDTLMEGEMRDRLLRDLTEIQKLIEQGILYAKAAKVIEANVNVDLAAYTLTIARSYQAKGASVVAEQACPLMVSTKAAALTTIISSLVDNALKFAGSAEIVVARDESGNAVIQVLDRGPGIPESELELVLRPFYRLEPSRNRDTGGSGLGLAIANELSRTLIARITLRNREGGGLVAQIAFSD